MNALVAWFVRNPVTVNLLTGLVLILGLFGAFSIRREIMPPWIESEVVVDVAYPGAGPSEIEQAIVKRIEEAVRDVPDVIELRSWAREGTGRVLTEIDPNADLQEALSHVKVRVDALRTLPVDAERPMITVPLHNHPVLRLSVHGEASDETLLHWSRVVRDDLMEMPDVGFVKILPPRVPEIVLEVSEHALRAHDTTLDQVVEAVRRFSVDLPAGEIEGPAGGRLRVDGEAFTPDEFAKIPVLYAANGTVVTAGELGVVKEELTQARTRARYQAEPSMILVVSRTEEQDAVEAAEQVIAYLQESQTRLPEGITVSLSADFTTSFANRVSNLFQNGAFGLVLVFVVLALFLRLATAFWVAAGIGVAGLGLFAAAPLVGVTLNTISMFGFVLVLGLLVDDAIIVGESVFRQQELDPDDRERASIEGTRAVMMPVIMAGVTTMAAFAPILWIPGNEAQTWAQIGIVVIVTLAISLGESLFLLPSHLAEFGRGAAGRTRTRAGRFFEGLRARVDGGMKGFVERRYAPALEFSLRRPEVVISAFLGLMIVMFGFERSGALPMAFFPEVEADAVMVNLELALGTSPDRTSELLQRMEDAALDLQQELDAEWTTRGPDESIFGPMMSMVGHTMTTREKGDHAGGIVLSINPRSDRPFTASEIGKRWREKVGPIPDATALSFDHTYNENIDSVDLRLAHPDSETLRAAADALQDKLRRIPGLYDVTDAERSGQQELTLALRPDGLALGLSLADLGRQVRQGFYGAEAQRVQRGRDDLRVMVRYPEEERRSIADLGRIRIRTADGQALPFAAVAEVSFGDAASVIRRTNRERTLKIEASVDTKTVELDAVTALLFDEFVPELERRFPGLRVGKGRRHRERDSMVAHFERQRWQLPLVIYLLLAAALRSYGQPLIVLLAIPFGQIGAILGHLIRGLPLSMLSLLGSLAAAGVVVNDSLVFLDAINRYRSQGYSLHDAVRAAARLRFRPIVLTSMTTFLGLLPIVLETSPQAQFLVPMAVSLAFGVLFATVVTLLLIPAVCAATARFWQTPRGVSVPASSADDADVRAAAVAASVSHG